LLSVDELVDELQNGGLAADTDQIRFVVEEHHLGVEPWPFGALTTA
jgi:hypothetical protein